MRTLPRLINLFFYIALAVVSLTTWPGAASADEAITESGLAERLKFYRDYQELQVHFRQNKHLANMNLDLKSTGTLLLKANGEIRWEIEQPSHVTVEIDPERVKIRSHDGTQVFKINDMSKDNVARGLGLLLPWLRMDAKALASDYKISRPKGGSYIFEPRNAGALLTKMQVDLAGPGHVRELRMFEISGDNVTIQFDTPKIVRKSP